MINKYFNELTRSLAEACFLVSRTGEILSVNPSGERMLGAGSKMLAGKRIADLVTDPNDKVSRYIQICLRNREPVSGAFRWRLNEGRTVECRCSGHLILADTKEDKNLVLLRCEPKEAESNKFIALNKTLEQLKASHHKLMAQSEELKNELIERKQAEGASRESQKRLLTILDSLDAMVYVADMKTYEVVFVNKYVRDLFGDIEGKICWQTLQADQTGPCDFCTNNKIVDAGGNPTSSYVWEFRNTKTDRWYYIVDRALSWVDGRIVRLEIATDITEREQAEETLRLHSVIMKNAAEGIYLLRLEDGIIVYANPKFEAMFGYDPGEMIGKNVTTVNAPGDKTPEETRNAIAAILLKNGEWYGEVENIRKDGSRFWSYANVSLFDHPEYGMVAVSIHTDVTERKRAEEELKQYRDNLEELVGQRTAEIEKKSTQLEQMNKLFVGRELRMIELKERIKELEKQIGSSST